MSRLFVALVAILLPRCAESPEPPHASELIAEFTWSPPGPRLLSAGIEIGDGRFAWAIVADVDTLAPGATSASAVVRCTTPGSASNGTPGGAVTQILDTLPGTVSVVGVTDALGGDDGGKPPPVRVGPLAAYEEAALRASVLVADVRAERDPQTQQVVLRIAQLGQPVAHTALRALVFALLVRQFGDVGGVGTL